MGTIPTAANLEVQTNLNNYNFGLSLANGNNFQTLVASGPEVIHWAKLTSALGFEKLQQVRVGFSEDCGCPSAVPEPASCSALGIGAICLFRRFRRK